jgi:hypothetical protein
MNFLLSGTSIEIKAKIISSDDIYKKINIDSISGNYIFNEVFIDKGDFLIKYNNHSVDLNDKTLFSSDGYQKGEVEKNENFILDSSSDFFQKKIESLEDKYIVYEILKKRFIFSKISFQSKIKDFMLKTVSSDLSYITDFVVDESLIHKIYNNNKEILIDKKNSILSSSKYKEELISKKNICVYNDEGCIKLEHSY